MANTKMNIVKSEYTDGLCVTVRLKQNHTKVECKNVAGCKAFQGRRCRKEVECGLENGNGNLGTYTIYVPRKTMDLEFSHNGEMKITRTKRNATNGQQKKNGKLISQAFKLENN